MSPVRPRSPAPNMSCLRYTSPTIHQGRRWPTGARYPSGKGEVCKTFMRRFDPDPRLQTFSTTYTQEVFGLAADWLPFDRCPLTKHPDTRAPGLPTLRRGPG